MFWWFKVLSRWISLKNFSNSSGFLVKFRSFTWFHATSIPSYSSKKKRQREKMNAITLSSKLPCQVLPRTVQNQTKKKSNQIDYNEAWTFKFRRIILFHIFQKGQLQQTQSNLQRSFLHHSWLLFEREMLEFVEMIEEEKIDIFFFFLKERIWGNKWFFH